MISIIYTTISSQVEAERLANLAIQNSLAVCVNLLPNMISVYKWEGKIDRSQECGMIFKTAQHQVPALKEWLLREHPYTLPAIAIFSADSSESFQAYITPSVNAFKKLF